MRGHFWESCQMGVTHKSVECDEAEWIWIHIRASTGSRLFYCHCLFKCALQWRKTGDVEEKKKKLAPLLDVKVMLSSFSHLCLVLMSLNFPSIHVSKPVSKVHFS